MNLLTLHREALIWVAAIVALYFMPIGEEHYSLCVPTALGFNWCPGCGLGHSIHYYLHFNFKMGWQEHPLGALAIVIIFHRIYQLVKPIKINQDAKPDF